MSYRRYYTPRRETAERPSRSFDPTLQLERDRLSNDMKLKGRFEHIFEKYAKDFSKVGDEIDMESGEVVVNNGHLECMQHERDVGSTATSQFLAAFEEELEEEHVEPGHGEGDSGSDLAPTQSLDKMDRDDDGDDEEDELSLDQNDSPRTASIHMSRPQTPRANNYDQTGVLDSVMEDSDSGSAHSSLAGHGNLHTAHPLSAGQSVSSSDNDESIMHSTELQLGLPPISIEDSLNALVPHQDESGRIDPAAIQDLGMSIANQIANFLMRATSGRMNHQTHFSRDPWSVPPLPKDAFGPRAALERATPDPERDPSVLDSPGATSLWAPPQAHSRPSKRRKMVHQIDPELMGRPMRDESESTRDGSEAPEFQAPHAVHPTYQYPRFSSTAKAKFTSEEDHLMKHLKEVDGMGWSQIAEYFPGRTQIALMSRYGRAARHLPRPVVIKREIVEIPDGEEGHESEGPTPNWRVIPPASHDATPGAPYTPMLARPSLDRGASPITIADEDEGFAANVPYAQYGPIPPRGYGYPPQGYHFPPPDTPGYYYPYGTYPSPDSRYYPAPKVRKSRVKKPRDHHNKSETQRRHTYYDTTQGDGRFGILRPDRRSEMAFESTPQQHIIGPMHASTGAFGMLRVEKPKVKANRHPREAIAELRPDSAGDGEPHAFLRREQQSPFEQPFRPGFDYIAAANAHRPPPEANTHNNPVVIRDESEAASATPYPDEVPAATDGPYFLDNVSRSDHDGEQDEPHVQQDSRPEDLQKSSPALPTPPSDSSTKFATPGVRGLAPAAQMTAAESGKGALRVGTRSARGTPARGTPTPSSQQRDLGVMKIAPRQVQQDDSEDELA